MKAPALNGKRPVGRPSLKTEEGRDEILSRIAQGDSLVEVCLTEGMPKYRTVLDWLRNDEDFRADYVRARDDQGDYHFDEMLQLSRTATAENWPVVKLQIDTLKYRAAKLRPKVYGDKPETSVNVSTVVHNHISAAQQQEYQERMQKALGR